jgi:hypothetical protein
MAKINTSGQLSVGTTAGAGQSVNGLVGGGNTQTNITTTEATYMGGNPARVTAVGAVCMPGQVEKTVNLANFSGGAISYNNSQATAWRQTALSEFRGAYTTRPAITTVAYAGTGNYNTGKVTITITPPADANIAGTCAVYLAGLSTAWATVNASNQITYTINRGTTYTAYVKDINNCGANMEISLGNIKYVL